MVRVIYETTEDCKRCPFNHGRICMKLGKYLFDICFEQDCPLPHLNEVEQFTRYVTEDKSLKCHGNCKHWKRWDYNERLRNRLERKTILLKIRTKHIDDREKSFHELLNYLESLCYKSNIDGNYAKQDIINILNNWEIREYD